MLVASFPTFNLPSLAFLIFWKPKYSNKHKLTSRKYQGCKTHKKQLVQQVWSEIQCLPSVLSEDFWDTMFAILERDLVQTENSWIDHKTELSGVVLDMERMIFKDLMNETIGDLGALSSRCRQPNLLSTPRRKLHFSWFQFSNFVHMFFECLSEILLQNK